MVKAGFAEDDAPRSVFPPIVGHPRCTTGMVGEKYKDTYVGDQAQPKRAILTLECPKEPGLVNWEEKEKVWHHTFYNELRITPEEHPVLLTEKPLNTKANREKMIEIMFEQFRVPSLNVCMDAVLGLYSTARVTGVVCDAGYSDTNIVSVHNGTPIAHTVSHMKCAGRQITRYLGTLLHERDHGGIWLTSAGLKNCNVLKEETCYCAKDFEAEMLSSVSKPSEIETSYTLPDGKHVTIGNERFRCVEPLFRPSLLGMEGAGAHELIHESVMKCDEALRQELLSNVVLVGGTSMFKGIPERLQRELSTMCCDLPNEAVNVVAETHRKYATWIGGAVIASLPTFSECLISNAEYTEAGPSILETKSCYLNSS